MCYFTLRCDPFFLFFFAADWRAKHNTRREREKRYDLPIYVNVECFGEEGELGRGGAGAGFSIGLGFFILIWFDFLFIFVRRGDDDGVRVRCVCICMYVPGIIM